MLGNSEVIGFIPTKQPDTAKAFYEQNLGLNLLSEDPFALVFQANSAQLRIVKMDEFQPAPYTIFGWQVDNIDKTVDKLSSQGIQFERFDGMDQDHHGVWTSPSGAKVAWFKDPDNNLLSVTG